MKRIFLPVLFTCLVTITFGQDLKKANSYVNDKKYEKAKTEIDGILAKDPTNSEALYLKSKVYAAMADSSAFKSLFSGDPYQEAFDAFKKALGDSANNKVKLMVIKDNYQPIFQVYAGYFGEAANAFNAAATSNNKPDTAGFAKAMELAERHRKSESERLRGLRDAMQTKLTNAFDWAVVSGNEKRRLASHLHISFPGLDAERLIFALEVRGVLVATGSACAANKGTRSHVLTAIGLAPEVADGSLRITLGKLSSEENTQRAADIIIEEVARERQMIQK